MNKKVVNQKNMRHPDPKKHLYASLIKSVVRLIGYAFIPFNLTAAALVLIVSELIGIVEELV